MIADPDWESLLARLQSLVGQDLLVAVHAPQAPMVACLSGELLSVDLVLDGVQASMSSPKDVQFTGFFIRRDYVTGWTWHEHDASATPEDDPGPLLTVNLGPTVLHVQPDEESYRVT